MPKPLRTRFVIADGSRARWISRGGGAGDFVTDRQLKTEAEPAGGPQGVVFESSSSRRSTVEPRNDPRREHRERFAGEVAEAISKEAEGDGFDRLVIVAPARTLSAIKARLSRPAATRLARTLAKDLTKTPDHELGTWLRTLEMG